MSCCPPPSVALHRFSYLWFSVASCRFCRTLPSPPHGGSLPRASSLVNGSVAVSGNRQSSGPGGPVAWYCTISCHHCSVRSACRKVVTSFRSSLPRTSQIVSLVFKCFVPVTRLQLSTLSLAAASCSVPLQPTALWWHLDRFRRRIALSLWLRLVLDLV